MHWVSTRVTKLGVFGYTARGGAKILNDNYPDTMCSVYSTGWVVEKVLGAIFAGIIDIFLVSIALAGD
jgi:hypothetical protein